MKKIVTLIAGASAAALMIAQPALAQNGTGENKTGLIAGAGLLAVVGAIALSDGGSDDPESP